MIWKSAFIVRNRRKKKKKKLKINWLLSFFVFYFMDWTQITDDVLVLVLTEWVVPVAAGKGTEAWMTCVGPSSSCCSAALQSLKRNSPESAAATSPLRLWWVGKSSRCCFFFLNEREIRCFVLIFYLSACVVLTLVYYCVACVAVGLLYVPLSLSPG